MAQAPERFDVAMRRAVDRWVGTTPPAIHLRLAASLAFLALVWVRPSGRSALYYTEHALGLTAATFLFPGLRDLERVYGTRLVAGAVFLLALGVPLVFAGVFTASAILGDASTFASPGAFWTVRAICSALAVGGWWAVFQVLRVRGEFARLLRRR